MAQLIDLADLIAYNKELSKHIGLLSRNTAYSLGNVVQYDERYFKCTTAGTSDISSPNFSSTGPYTDGTVQWTEFNPNSQIYETGKSYAVNDLVVYNNNWYKCTTAHTATSTFDTTKWIEVGGGDSLISDWGQLTEYAVGDLVIYNNILYRCNTAHTSTSTFDTNKFTAINAFTTSTAYAQKVSLGVTAPYEMLFRTGDSNYCKAPVNVLKQTGGQTNVSITLENFNNSSAYTKNGNFVTIGSGKAKLNAYKDFTTSPLVLDTQTVYVTPTIDYSGFKYISDVVDEHTIMLLHFDDGLTTDYCGNTLTTIGSPTFVDDSKFGTKAYYNNNTSDYTGFTVSANSAFNFGTVDFTIDFWWKSDQNITRGVCSLIRGTIASSTASSQYGIYINYNFSSGGYNTVVIEYSTKDLIAIPSFTLPTDNKYHHYAIVRNNDVVIFFIDGIITGSVKFTLSLSMQGRTFRVFTDSSFKENTCGTVDEFRISNIARWTTNFTPRTSAYGGASTYEITSLKVM